MEVATIISAADYDEELIEYLCLFVFFVAIHGRAARLPASQPLENAHCRL